MLRHLPRILSGLLIGAVLGTGSARAEPSVDFEHVRFLMEDYCNWCHGSDEPEEGLDLSRFDTPESVLEDRDAWNRVLNRVRAGEMPPLDSVPLPLEERDALIEWIEHTLRASLKDAPLDPGPAPLRRLNKAEYTRTIRDLLGVHFDAGHALPDDGAGASGFDNAAEALFLSPVHVEQYLEAAEEALAYASRNSASRELLLIAEPDDEMSDEQAAERILEHFAQRAFRRPVEVAEVERLMGLFDTAREAGDSFDEAVYYAMEMVLISPHFLFRMEQIPEGPDPELVSDYELATRLSYFLWGTMPDEELFELAAEGKLHDEQVLTEQALRMLRDERVRGLAEPFTGQWLGTRGLGREVRPDPERFPEFDHQLETAMKEEPIHVMEEILRGGPQRGRRGRRSPDEESDEQPQRSLLDLIDADFSYITRDLAHHYRIADQIDANLQFGQPVRVELPEGSRRGGVITMAAVLAVTSHPERTSPVLRGQWVLEKLLGSAPPPPPPGVDELEEEPGEGPDARTLRELLETHRNSPDCISCHERIDPIGFGLENFDVLGRWRTEMDGRPIDASGELPGGVAFDGPEELKQILMDRRDEFVRHLTVQMFSYALGRGLENVDHRTVDEIVERLRENDYRAQELVLGIVHSAAFRYRPGTDSELSELSEQEDEQ